MRAFLYTVAAVPALLDPPGLPRFWGELFAWRLGLHTKQVITSKQTHTPPNPPSTPLSWPPSATPPCTRPPTFPLNPPSTRLPPPPRTAGEQLLQKATQLALDSLPRMKDNTVATLVWVMGQF